MRTLTSACLTLFLALFLAGPAAAQTVDLGCAITDKTEARADACAAFVGCFTGSGTYFTGRAIGWNSGTLAAETSEGVFCTGTWQNTGGLKPPTASFECDNGESGLVVYTHQDPRTGTATGSGVTDRFRRVEIWSGNNIRQFLADETGEIDPKLMCGDAEIPIS